MKQYNGKTVVQNQLDNTKLFGIVAYYQYPIEEHGRGETHNLFIIDHEDAGDIIDSIREYLLLEYPDETFSVFMISERSMKNQPYKFIAPTIKEWPTITEMTKLVDHTKDYLGR